MIKLSNCSVCENPLHGRQTSFCSVSCKNRKHQGYESQKLRWIEKKIRFVKEFWGCCSVCGYGKNLSALAFHHTEKKEFKLDVRSLSNRGAENIRRELAKCVLVCHNCHAEIHHPELDVGSLPL